MPPVLFLGLFVFSVLSAVPAVFADSESVGIVFLVLHRGVIAALAIAACQREDDSIVFLGHGFILISLPAKFRGQNPVVVKTTQKKKTPCQVSMEHSTYNCQRVSTNPRGAYNTTK